jgi:hypothetical protein
MTNFSTRKNIQRHDLKVGQIEWRQLKLSQCQINQTFAGEWSPMSGETDPQHIIIQKNTHL